LQNQGLAQIEQQKAQAAQQLKMMESEEAKMQFSRDIIKEYYKFNPQAAEPFIAMVTGQIPISVANQTTQTPQSNVK
jgi:uncharacterized protein (DUF3084 family)